MKVREIGESPFCWQAKIVLKTILEAFEYNRAGKASSGIAVYSGLSHIASDVGRDQFTTTIANIARYSGLAPRTVTTILDSFERLGILHIRRNRIPEANMQIASTYTLQSVDEIYGSTEITLCNFYQPPSKNEESPNLPRYKEI
jgi:DNA-binding MarR family transcriptional regulator